MAWLPLAWVCRIPPWRPLRPCPGPAPALGLGSCWGTRTTTRRSMSLEMVRLHFSLSTEGNISWTKTQSKHSWIAETDGDYCWNQTKQTDRTLQERGEESQRFRPFDPSAEQERQQGLSPGWWGPTLLPVIFSKLNWQVIDVCSHHLSLLYPPYPASSNNLFSPLLFSPPQ